MLNIAIFVLLIILYVIPFLMSLVEANTKLILNKKYKLENYMYKSITPYFISTIPIVNIIFLLLDDFMNVTIAYNKILNETYKCRKCEMISRGSQYDNLIIKEMYGYLMSDVSYSEKCIHCQSGNVNKDNKYIDSDIPLANKFNLLQSVVKLHGIYFNKKQRVKVKNKKKLEELKSKQIDIELADKQLENYNKLQFKKLKELEEKANQIKKEMSGL